MYSGIFYSESILKAPNCKHTKCLPTEEWINCSVFIQRNSVHPRKWRGNIYNYQHGIIMPLMLLVWFHVCEIQKQALVTFIV